MTTKEFRDAVIKGLKQSSSDAEFLGILEYAKEQALALYLKEE